MSTILEEIIRATDDGDEEKTVALARQAMEDGMEPFDVIQNGYARGMEIVGEKFARLDYFLPEVMLAADALTAAIDYLNNNDSYHYFQEIDDQETAVTTLIKPGSTGTNVNDLVIILTFKEK